MPAQEGHRVAEQEVENELTATCPILLHSRIFGHWADRAGEKIEYKESIGEMEPRRRADQAYPDARRAAQPAGF